MNINPRAVIMWVFLALIGFIFGDTHGAAIGAASGLGLSILLDLLK